MEMTLRLGRIWWAGFKVMCRWYAFAVVLAVVFLPLTGIIAGIAYLDPDYSNSSFLLPVFLLIAPIPFYLTSRYLLLLEDRQPPSGVAESPGAAGEQRDYGLRMKIAVSVAAIFAGSVFLTPSPDPFSGLVLGTAGAILCGVSLLLLSRLRFVKSASKSMQTLICVLVCLLSLLAMFSWVATHTIIRLHRQPSPSSAPTSVVSSSR